MELTHNEAEMKAQHEATKNDGAKLPKTHAQQAEALVREHYLITHPYYAYDNLENRLTIAKKHNHEVYEKAVNHAILTTEKQLDLLEKVNGMAVGSPYTYNKVKDLTAILNELKQML